MKTLFAAAVALLTAASVAAPANAAGCLKGAIVGGTGIYQNAGGGGTIQVPPDVPNLTDANFVLNLTGE